MKFSFFSPIDVAPIQLYVCALPSPGRTPKKLQGGGLAPIEHILIKVRVHHPSSAKAARWYSAGKVLFYERKSYLACEARTLKHAFDF